jgi:quinol monooxygenase YgiN
MTNTQIKLVGYIDVPESRLAKITAALPEHIRLTRLEAGCVSFNVTPDADQTGRFNVAEVFATRADFDQHQSRTKSSKWAKITQGIPRSYSITEND